MLFILNKPAFAMTNEQFVNKIGEEAKDICRDNDLYASVLIAQAIVESNFGKSGISVSPANNLFGIKGSYNGNSVLVNTKEDDGSGNLYTIKSAFKKYPSTRDSILDYVNLLSNYGNNYYGGTKKSVTNGDYKKATRFLTGRYATDTSYHNKLNRIISVYNLTRFDLDPGEAIEPTLVSSIIPTEVEVKSIDSCDEIVNMYDDILKKVEDLDKAVTEAFSLDSIEPEIVDVDNSFHGGE